MPPREGTQGPPRKGRGRPERDSEGKQVSFSEEVAPLLVAKCRRCHIEARKGGFSLATYADLLRGSDEAGRVVVRGKAPSSVMIDLVASGEMPRGPDRLTPQELELLVRWVNQGARERCDDNDGTFGRVGRDVQRRGPTRAAPSRTSAGCYW